MNIIEHELGHVCLGVQVSDVVRVSLENDVYLVESMPTVFRVRGPVGSPPIPPRRHGDGGCGSGQDG